jgi:uncharacterized protein (TIGR02186 family)
MKKPALVILIGCLSVAAAVRVLAQAEAKPGAEISNPAAPSEVVTDFSKAKIEVGINYRGDHVELFGTLGNTDADAVVVKLLSPPETVKLNQKGRVGPFWINVKQHTVENVPFLYQVNASDKFERIMSADQMARLGIGFVALKDQIKVHTTKGKSDPGDAEIIFQGLLRLKMRLGLYQLDDRAITIKQGRLFKHAFDFPAATKEGDYQVVTYLFKQGRLVHQTTDTIHVSKIGLIAKLVQWAQDYPKLYGLSAVLIALGAGLLVGFIFRGGGH